MRKKSKQSISAIQRKIWEHCKRLIRSRYEPYCYTCGSGPLCGKNLHTGHMIAKSSLSAFMKYDLRLLRPQCAICNIFRGGMGSEFYRRMVEVEGQDYVDSIYKDLKITVKASDHYNTILKKYEAET